jgi:outer membrane protein assembly factor BamB
LTRAIGVRASLLAATAIVAVACGGGHASGALSTHIGASAKGHVGRIPSDDWPTFGYDSARTGVGPASTGITSGDVGRLKLRAVRIGGIADSAAIELNAVTVKGRRRDVIFVTTSYGNTVAIDPGTGAKLWTFVPHGVNQSPGNPQVTTASPTADPNRRYIYTASPNGVIHKLSVATGQQVWARSITFDPVHEKIASSLNVSGPYVVAVTGGYIGDIPPYDGHVVTIDRSNGDIAHVWNSECSNRHLLIRASSCSVTKTNGDNAMWGRAGAVIEPGNHRILTSTGNGPFNGIDNWGDSALELSPDASRLLHNWTPTNQAQLDANDVDVGSASPALLPTYHGFRLAVQGGKDGILHLLNLNRLDGTTHGAGPRLGGQVSQVGAPGGAEVLTAPAAWEHGGRILLFVGDDSGTGAYQLVGGSHPRLHQIWGNGTPSTSPVIAGGLLYAYNEMGGQLVIRRPSNGSVVRVLSVGDGHWNSPIVVGGRIIEPTGNYHDSSTSTLIDIYHLPGR